MKFFIAFALILAAASAAVLHQTKVRSELDEIQQIIAAIHSPSTDPATAAALEQMLQDYLGVGAAIIGPGHTVVDGVAPAPVAIGPAIIDFPLPDGGAVTAPVDVAPAPVTAAAESSPLVQIVVNVNAPSQVGAGPVTNPVEIVHEPAKPAKPVKPEPLPIIEMLPIGLENLPVVDPVQVADIAPVVVDPVQVVDVAPVVVDPVQVANPIIVEPVQIVDVAPVVVDPIQVVDVAPVVVDPVQVVNPVVVDPVQVVDVAPVVVDPVHIVDVAPVVVEPVQVVHPVPSPAVSLPEDLN